MANEMMERVRLVLRTYCHDGLALIAAKDVIAAMREPTEEMLEPVTNADGYFKVSDPKQSYRAMIDAALKD